MTTDKTPAVTAADLVSALRSELLAETDAADQSLRPEDEDWVAAVLGAAAPSRAVDEAARSLLVDTSALLTAHRSGRLIAAVDRALEPLAERNLPLPLLLRTRRLQQGTALEELAAAAGIEPKTLDHLERGGREVGEQNEQVVANWIAAVRVDQGLALSALNRTLAWEQRAAGELAAGRTTDPSDADAFIERVRSLLPPAPEGEK